jgi:nucleoside-diphosphate-sugar epimerase
LQQAVSHLPGTLELFQADLMQDGSFDAAIAGAEYVYHVASPFFIQSDNPQKDLIDPAVQGTKNVLASIAKQKGTVKRCVVTSSVCGEQRQVICSVDPVLMQHSASIWPACTYCSLTPLDINASMQQQAAARNAA